MKKKREGNKIIKKLMICLILFHIVNNTENENGWIILVYIFQCFNKKQIYSSLYK